MADQGSRRNEIFRVGGGKGGRARIIMFAGGRGPRPTSDICVGETRGYFR